MTNDGFTIDGPLLGQSAVCAAILAALPEWFDIPAENEQFVRDVPTLPTWVARADDRTAGLLTIKPHNVYVAEIYLLGVRREFQHRGIGRALMACAEDAMRAAGIEYMQVKTLGPSSPDPNYVRTRAFYAGLGYRPLEEFKTIWDENNPCLILIKAL